MDTETRIEVEKKKKQETLEKDKEEALIIFYEKKINELRNEIIENIKLLSNDNKNKYYSSIEKTDKKKKLPEEEEEEETRQQSPEIIKLKAIEANLFFKLHLIKSYLNTQKSDDFRKGIKTGSPIKFESLTSYGGEKESEYYSRFIVDIYEAYEKNETELYMPDSVNWQISPMHSSRKILNMLVYINQIRQEIVIVVRGTDFTNMKDIYYDLKTLVSGIYDRVDLDNKYTKKIVDIINDPIYNNYKITLAGHSAGGAIVLASFLNIMRVHPQFINRFNKIYLFNPLLVGSDEINYDEGLKDKLNIISDKIQIYTTGGDFLQYINTIDLGKKEIIEQKIKPIWYSLADEHTIFNFLSYDLLNDPLFKKLNPTVKTQFEKTQIEKKLEEKETLAKDIETMSESKIETVTPPQKPPRIRTSPKPKPFEMTESEAKAEMAALESEAQKRRKQQAIDEIVRQKKRAELFKQKKQAIIEKGLEKQAEQLIEKKKEEEKLRKESQTIVIPRERVREAAVYKEVIKEVNGKKVVDLVKVEKLGESEKKRLTIEPGAYKARPVRKAPKFIKTIDLPGTEVSTKVNPFNVPIKDSEREGHSIIQLGKPLPTLTKSKGEIVKKYGKKSLVKNIQKSTPVYKI